MENATYASLTRQSGLMSELRSIANNIANASTTGYRAEGVIFSEHVTRLGRNHASLSMPLAQGRDTSFEQGGLSRTGGTFDLAIEGEGFFLVQTPEGERLSRNGHFTPNENGDLVTADGYPVLDAGGAPVFVPQGVTGVAIASDGTISADGQPIGQIGLYLPEDPNGLVREDGVRFRADAGVGPAPLAHLVQGFLEQSNVNPILEVSRMIEVQRAYELGQSFLDLEDQRIRNMIRDIHR
ncbi:flagellar hook-basal body complex protein [Ponticoccus sp. SC2-23]|uniref:flagellar hook-basal body complex protein n=1 Tax=Alexandriicola marinus TaxID=2081710 RepID=UPI000FD92A80|nr:flagellar hook-basal body complex protein [Alexandriicola marinus]MBM1220511.1 flagellar hook-basal body complex protein [Ponticoccus sp. SC6-9]MBM1225197.1 flagellar hook-basal body complex protein [Ponticoccus sp. SC6-15]MBM1228711.1 flagellar hook-basal body complex protein [Ponticoccus sp. SC6-38]MBM1233652.1 flagellar hook-basal body complex protein [Ponticoccus sp. SC6-45]MBM1239212.1 flagellar hook-basal body complex protein [Ponticoccus sp. SC6-49]MBM1242994.1 flagellar hook-basal 